MAYTLPAQERGEKRSPDGYELVRICTDGLITVASVQNGQINKAKEPHVMTAFACVDEGPLAGKCVTFSRVLTPKSMWSLKNAMRATGTDEGIPENVEYTFKNDADILDRVHRMTGPAFVTQQEMPSGDIVSMLNYFISPDDTEELASHELAQPIANTEPEDLDI